MIQVCYPNRLMSVNGQKQLKASSPHPRWAKHHPKDEKTKANNESGRSRIKEGVILFWGENHSKSSDDIVILWEIRK